MSDTITRQKTGAAGGYSGAPAAGVPPCGVEDVDAAVLRALSTDICLQVSGDKGSAPVRAIFAAGERWSQIKRGAMLRDANGALILPLIAVIRTGVAQDVAEDVTGRGINQQTGKLRVMRRRVKSDDAAYQRLVNRVGVKGGAWSAPRSATALTRTSVGSLLSSDRNVAAGGVMLADTSDAVTEIITVSSPQFYTVKYDVKIWTAYATHMNEISEKLMASYLPSDRAFKLVTDKGYWFVAYVDSADFALDSNSDGVGDGERLVRGSMQLRVPAYLVAAGGPGAPSPARSLKLKPDISFAISESDALAGDAVAPFAGADDPTLPLSVRATRRQDGRAILPSDPADLALARGEQKPTFKRDRRVTITKIDDRYIRSRVISAPAGETSHSGLSLADFEVAVG